MLKVLFDGLPVVLTTPGASKNGTPVVLMMPAYEKCACRLN